MLKQIMKRIWRFRRPAKAKAAETPPARSPAKVKLSRPMVIAAQEEGKGLPPSVQIVSNQPIDIRPVSFAIAAAARYWRRDMRTPHYTRN